MAFLLLASGCTQASPTRLPDLQEAPRALLTPAEQQAAVHDLEQEKSVLTRDALEKIRR